MPSVHELIERNLEKQANQRLAAMIMDACKGRTEDGDLVRGIVTSVKCMHCGNRRWDDGRKCPCGHMKKEMLNEEDENRV